MRWIQSSLVFLQALTGSAVLADVIGAKPAALLVVFTAGLQQAAAAYQYYDRGNDREQQRHTAYHDDRGEGT